MDELSTEPVADLPLFPEILVEGDEEPNVLEDVSTEEVTVEIEAEPVVKAKPARPTSEAHQPTSEEVHVAQAELPMSPTLDEGRDEAGPAAEEISKVARAEKRRSDGSASLLARAWAAAIDATAMLATLGLLLAGGALLGAATGLRSLAFYLPTLLVFSFLYHVLPLMFWGRTPGMVRAGVVARATDGASMTGAQALRRWIAGQVTVLLVGLPGLAALAGRSFSDRASGTVTLSG